MASQPKRIVLCLDGTWNSAYKAKERDDGARVLKPSNPLKMARSVRPADRVIGQVQTTYYDPGVGALGRYPGLSNQLLGFVDSRLGGAWGAGFEAKVEEAAAFLVNNYLPGDQVFIFGFSRGAAEARSLTRFLDWLGGLPTKRDAYFLPLFFREYVRGAGQSLPERALSKEERAALEDPIVPIEIELLAVWDTVMALGSRFRGRGGTTTASRSFHVDSLPATCVHHARQALAIDERRFDFRPEIWSGHASHQTLRQRWFCGAHSDVGGGYVDDGLANCAFQWILAEAASLGLDTNDTFSDHYRAYPQDRIHDSNTRIHRTLALIRLRRGRGERSLRGHSPDANLEIDGSVFERLLAAPENHKELGAPYRPENVIKWLAAQGDLPAVLASAGVAADHLPADLARAIGSRRR